MNKKIESGTGLAPHETKFMNEIVIWRENKHSDLTNFL